MFEWKVEEMKLMETKSFNLVSGKKIYKCEETVPRKEKIAFVDSLHDGKLSYILELAEKFDNEKDKLPKNSWGDVKTVSLKAWLKKNDPRKIVDSKYDYGTITFFWNVKRNIHNLNLRSAYSTYKDYVDEIFHNQLVECERAEKVYFQEHDEYSVLKSKFKEKKYTTTFGVHIGCCSDGSVYIYDEEHSKTRDITIEELKYLLEKYEELDKLVEKITKETNIKF